jgi:hypothetical protein
MKFGHEKLGRTTKCVFKLVEDFLGVLAFVFDCINFATDSTVFELDAWRGLFLVIMFEMIWLVVLGCSVWG